MIFFCRWEGEHVSLVIDAVDEENARDIATEEREAPPDVITAIPPGVIVLDVFFSDEDDDPDHDDEEAVLVVEPYDHTLDALAALENADGLPVAGGAIVELGIEPCGAEADDDEDQAIVCQLVAGHDGEHRAGEFSWGTQ